MMPRGLSGKCFFTSSAIWSSGITAVPSVLTVTLSLMVVATAVWVRRTVPMVMVWMGVFGLLRLFAHWLVDGLKYDQRWRLIDLWNDTYLVGNFCLGDEVIRSAQPAVYQAGLVLGALTLVCLIYLNRRIRAVEIVR